MHCQFRPDTICLYHRCTSGKYQSSRYSPPADENTAHWSMNDIRLIPVLVQSIQELSEQNALLPGRLQTLETEVSFLKSNEKSK